MWRIPIRDSESNPPHCFIDLVYTVLKTTFHDLFLAKCEDHFSWSDSSKMWRTLFMICFWQNVKITFHYLFLAKCEDHFSWSVSGKMWRPLFMICFWQNVKTAFHYLFLAKCEDHFSWSVSGKSCQSDQNRNTGIFPYGYFKETVFNICVGEKPSMEWWYCCPLLFSPIK